MSYHTQQPPRPLTSPYQASANVLAQLLHAMAKSRAAAKSKAKKSRPSRQTTVVVQQRAAGPRTQRKRGKMGAYAPAPTTAFTPNPMSDYPMESGARLVNFPIELKCDITIPTAKAAIALFAPVNDVVGEYYTSDGATVDTVVTLTDASLTSFLAAGSTRGDIRWLKFCIEITAVDPLSSLSGEVTSVRWCETGVPLWQNVVIANFISTRDAILTSARNLERGGAYFARSKVLHTGMISPVGLSFNELQSGAATWRSAFTNTAGSTNALSVTTYPWAAIAIYFTGNVAATVSTNYRVNVRGVVQMKPSESGFLARLAVKVPPTAPDVRHRYFQQQQRLVEMPYLESATGMTRSIAGQTGLG